MDFQSAMETFAEAWVAANTKGGGLADVGCSQSHAMALTRNCKTPSVTPPPPSHRGPNESSPMDRPPPPLTPHQEVTALSAPKEEFESSKSSPAKSLPVHCIVEAISSLNDTKLLWKKKPLIETDSYVIISSNTAFHDLVHVALQMLGYPRDVFSAAKGSILIKNWKPLSFESIADGPLVTVGDILGELTTVATLKIQLYRSRPNILSDIKEKLLRILLAQSHSLLESTGCPLDEVTLSQMCRGQSLSPPLAEPSEECRRKFEQWWSTQVNQHHQHSGAPHNRRPSPASRYSPHHRPSASPGKAPPPPPDTVHPALQTVQSQYPTQKTRMRTSFDPELELPKLQRWFAENQHPSRQQIQHYVKELNGLESRRGRKPLDVNNVVYWFKNARAAQKRAELRSIGPGMSCHLSLNGYSSNSHSPPNSGAGILIGQDSLMGESRLLQPTLKCSSPPTRSPTRGPLFLSDHHSDNSNDGGQMSDQDYEEDRLVDGRLEHRDFRDEIRGDPRDDIRNRTEMNDGRDTGSPVAPLSLTTNDKERTSNLSKQYKTAEDTNRKEERGDPLRNDEKKGMMSGRMEEVEALNITNRPLSLIMNDKDNTISTNQEDIHEIEGIKQEPPDDVASNLLTTNNNNLSNKQEAEDMSDIDEEDDDEDVEDIDERRKYNIETDEELGSIHSGRISDLSRPSDRLRAFRSPSPSDLIVSRGPPTGQPGLDRLTAAGFPLVPNSMFSHSIMYMSHYIPGLTHQHHGHHPSIGPSTAPSSSNVGLNLSALASSADERRKRNRTFIDPVTEVPRLEQWFSLNTHPSHNLILKYTEELNRMPYRQKFPRLEPKNVQFWFKNRRAKCKRLKMSLFETGPSGIQANLQPLPYHQQPPSEDSLRNRD